MVLSLDVLSVKGTACVPCALQVSEVLVQLLPLTCDAVGDLSVNASVGVRSHHVVNDGLFAVLGNPQRVARTPVTSMSCVSKTTYTRTNSEKK